ncbi:MAG: cytochrome b5 domain-containing protein, partial [Desulfobacterales bacterium]
MQEFDPQTLAENNGQDGKKILIAYEGKVYDVSGSKMWKGGLHMRRHNAGTDLTTDIQAAPHGTEVLERYPQVGVVKKEEEVVERKMPRIVAWLLETNPFFRRHPHPMTVHFPIVFFLANPFFNVLYIITGNKSFE